jgi:hypothetical protein
MSESGKVENARPTTFKDNGLGNQFDTHLYCGGGGAGFFPPPIGVVGKVIEYRVSKLIVRNMRLILRNTFSYGVAMYQDSGGTIPADVYVGLSDVSTDPLEATAKASGLILDDGTLDLDTLLDFDVERLIPQPFKWPWEGGGPNPDWSAKIYVYLWWGSADYYNYGNPIAQVGQPTGVLSIENRSFNIEKHDNEIKV